MKTSTLYRSVPMILGAMLALPAAAQISLGSTGYFRVGPQATAKDSNRACYGLSGAEWKYRLGNECDFYGEFLFTGNIKQATGETVKISLMPNIYNGSASESGDAKLGMAQMYAEVGGLDFAPQASFWAGKRYHRGADVHIVDKFFEQLDGTGAGATVNALGGKLDVAYYRADGAGAAGAQKPGNRLNAWLRDAPVNPGGTVNVVLNVTKGDFTGGKAGTALSLRHSQANILGGSNNLWFQVAQGSAGLTGNFGDLTASSDVKKFRIADGFQFQVNEALGGQAIASFQSNKSDAGDATITSLGGRVSYALSRNFKLVSELGIDRVKPSGGSAANLTKFTIAPTLAAGKGFWDRPELRFYVTTAKWNDAANTQAGLAGLTGIGDGKTSGTSYGVQAEIWW
jgi:maltoporin